MVFSDKAISLDKKVKKYADIAYIIGLAFFLASQACFLTRSQLFFIDIFGLIGTVVLILVGIYRLVVTLAKNWRIAIVAIAVLLFSFVYSWVCVEADAFPLVALAIVGAIGVSADKVLVAGIIGNLVMIADNVIISVFDTPDSVTSVYASKNLFFFGNNSFSFNKMNNYSSTDFAAHYLWIVAAYVWIRGKKLTWGEILALGTLNLLIYSLTGSLTALLSISAIVFIAIVYKFKVLISHKADNSEVHGFGSVLKKVIAFCSRYSFVILAVITVFLAAIYRTDNELMYKINDALHDRISLGHRGIVESGIHLISSNVTQYGINTSYDGYYNFLDCSYINILVRFGIVPLIFYIGSLTAIQIRQKKYLYGLLILTVCALSCVQEHHLSEIPYNFFLLLLFADISEDKINGVVSEQKKTVKRIFNYSAIILSLVFAVSFVFINLPRYKTVKKLDSLDARAGDIYNAVQDNLDKEVSSGEWQQKTLQMDSVQYGDMMSNPRDFESVAGMSWDDAVRDPKAHSYFRVYFDSNSQYEILGLIVSDEVRSLVGSGSCVIEYDVCTGKVYSVWYSEDEGCYSLDHRGGRSEDRSGRLLRDVPLEGYYTGKIYG